MNGRMVRGLVSAGAISMVVGLAGCAAGESPAVAACQTTYVELGKVADSMQFAMDSGSRGAMEVHLKSIEENIVQLSSQLQIDAGLDEHLVPTVESLTDFVDEGRAAIRTDGDISGAQIAGAQLVESLADLEAYCVDAGAGAFSL